MDATSACCVDSVDKNAGTIQDRSGISVFINRPNIPHNGTRARFLGTIFHMNRVANFFEDKHQQ